MDIRSLGDFRRWATSAAFPDRGRIDFLAGSIEVEMSPEDFFCHGTLKSEIAATLYQRVKGHELGHLVTDRTRVSCPEADLSVEPDVVFISQESLDTGRVRLVPRAGGAPGRYVEVEGPPDLIVEIVSDASVAKDTQRLPKAYFQAGVQEYWLVDAREDLTLHIHHRGPNGFERAGADAEGFQPSIVLAIAYHLAGHRDEKGHWRFDLHQR